MIRPFVFAFCLSTPIMANAEGFCVDDLADLPLSPNLLSPTATLASSDANYVQIIDTSDASETQIEVFLGVDWTDEEGLLRTENPPYGCPEYVTNCTITFIEYGPAVGVQNAVTVNGNRSETAISLYTGGEAVVIEINDNRQDPTKASDLLNRTFDALLPSLFAPCDIQ